MMSDLVTLTYGNISRDPNGPVCSGLLDTRKSLEKDNIDSISIEAAKEAYDRLCSPSLQKKLERMQKYCETTGCYDQTCKTMFNKVCKDVEAKKKEAEEALQRRLPKREKIGDSRRNIFMPKQESEKKLLNTRHYDRNSSTYEKGNKIAAKIGNANMLARLPRTITGEM